VKAVEFPNSPWSDKHGSSVGANETVGDKDGTVEGAGDIVGEWDGLKVG